MSLLAFSLSIATAFFWAVSPLLLKFGGEGVESKYMNPIRSFGFLGTALLIVLFSSSSVALPVAAFKAFPLIVINVILGNILGDISYFISLKKIGVSMSVGISSAYPMIAVFLSVAILGERPGLLVWIATFVIVIGLVIMGLPRNGDKVNTNDASGIVKQIRPADYVWILMSTLCWGVSTPITRWLVDAASIEPVALHFWRGSAFFALSWLYWIFQAKTDKAQWLSLPRLGKRPWIALLCAGCCGLGLGGMTYIKAVSMAPSSLVTPISSASPLLAALLAYFFYKEKLTLLQIAGMILIIVGAVMIGIFG